MSMNNDVQRETALLRSQEAQGLSERLIVSHWENNYGGAVKRLNAITTQLAAWISQQRPSSDQWTEARRTDRDELHDPA